MLDDNLIEAIMSSRLELPNLKKLTNEALLQMYREEVIDNRLLANAAQSWVDGAERGSERSDEHVAQLRDEILRRMQPFIRKDTKIDDRL